MICRLLFRALGLCFARRRFGPVMCPSSSLGGFPSRAVHGFVSLSRYGLGSLLGLPPNSFGSVFCLLTYCFQSILDRFSCFFRAVLHVLDYTFLPERSQSSRYDQSSDQTRHFHVSFLRLFTSQYWIESGVIIARTRAAGLNSLRRTIGFSGVTSASVNPGKR